MELQAQAFGQRVRRISSRGHAKCAATVAALSGLSDAAGGAGQAGRRARTGSATIAGREPRNADVRIELSRVLAVTGDGQGAFQAAIDALDAGTGRAARGESSWRRCWPTPATRDRLAPFADSLVARFPGPARAACITRRPPCFFAAVTRRRLPRVRRRDGADPDHARAQSLLGAACAAVGRRDCALAAFEASIRANPRDASGYVNAGLISLQSGATRRRPSDFFASALTIDPTSKPARDGLCAGAQQGCLAQLIPKFESAQDPGTCSAIECRYV